MNTIKHTHSNFIPFSSSSSSSPFFHQSTLFHPWPRLPPPPPPPQSIAIRPPNHRTIHASTSPPHLSNNAPPPENHLTPIHYLERAAAVYGASPAIIYNGVTRNWSDTLTRCLKLASSIAALGISRGDVVSVVAPNIPAAYELHFAAPMAGAILNAINLRLDAKSISNLLRHSNSKLVFVDFQSASVVNDAVSLLPPNHRPPILALIGDDDGSIPIEINYEKMVESGDVDFEWVRPLSEWDPIVLNYTSGTTAAAPKGVVLSHRAAALQAVNMVFEWGVPQRGTVHLWTLPMFHCNGWNMAWGMAAVGGANVCLRRVEAEAVYGALEEHGVTHMCGAPVVLNMLSNYAGSKALKAPVHVLTAGAPPPAAVLARAESLGFVVSHGYGLTETGGPAVMCVWKQEWDDLPGPERARLKARQGVGSIFSPEVDVVDPRSGKSVPHDGLTTGEIALRGATLMSGYLNDPDATSRSMKNGWFWTGDIGVMHEDGYLEVKDRSKDVIICGGENISSVEVEAALYAHPAVREAAVVARPDKYWGETPCAFVSLKEEAERTSEKAIREFCKERLPLFMVPRTVVFEAELPKTATGKVQKFLLREMAKGL